MYFLSVFLCLFSSPKMQLGVCGSAEPRKPPNIVHFNPGKSRPIADGSRCMKTYVKNSQCWLFPLQNSVAVLL